MTRTPFRIDLDDPKHLWILLLLELALLAGFISGCCLCYREYQATGDDAYLRGIVFLAVLVGLPLALAIGFTVRKILIHQVVESAEVRFLKAEIRAGERVPFEMTILARSDAYLEGATLTIRAARREQYEDWTGARTVKETETYSEVYALGPPAHLAKGKPLQLRGEMRVPENATPSGVIEESFEKGVISGEVVEEKFGGVTARRETRSVWHYELALNISNCPDWKVVEEFTVLPSQDLPSR